LRCFYGESIRSGEDLKANLKQLAGSAVRSAAVLLLLVVIGYNAAGAQQSGAAITSTALEKEIEQVIHQSKYAWRLPRAAVEDEVQKGMVSSFLEDIGRLMRSAVRASWNRVAAWLREWLKDSFNPRANGSAFSWISSSLLLYLLTAIVVAILVVFFFRLWRDRNRRPAPVTTEPVSYAPDVADENVGADQLPVDGWVQLAQTLLKEGNFRLALRALYLSSLAHLAQRNLIALAKFKSNGEYAFELRRRGSAFPELPPMFAENVSFFERIWYGAHEANEQVVYQFAENVERITGVNALQPR
jgi:hypothetical protein